MSNLPRNLGIRLDDQLSKRIESFENRTGVGAVTLGRNALIAALNRFEAEGKISFPLYITDAKGETAPVVLAPDLCSRLYDAPLRAQEALRIDLTADEAELARRYAASKIARKPRKP